jgi:hypothetical protein
MSLKVHPYLSFVKHKVQFERRGEKAAQGLLYELALQLYELMLKLCHADHPTAGGFLSDTGQQIIHSIGPNR